MSKRAEAVVAILAEKFPQYEVRVEKFNSPVKPVDAPDGPVIALSDGTAQGFTVAIHGADCDDISAITADVFRFIDKLAFDLSDEEGQVHELYLTFQKSTPILDASDFRVGEAMSYRTLHRSYAQAA